MWATTDASGYICVCARVCVRNKFSEPIYCLLFIDFSFNLYYTASTSMVNFLILLLLRVFAQHVSSFWLPKNRWCWSLNIHSCSISNLNFISFKWRTANKTPKIDEDPQRNYINKIQCGKYFLLSFLSFFLKNQKRTDVESLFFRIDKNINIISGQ